MRFFLVKMFLLVFLAIGLCGLAAARADESVQAAQRQLKEGGFYSGEASGVYDSATSAAVTRYQIRHGLAISGRLDPATAKALGVAPAPAAMQEPSPTSGTWRQLRNGDMQFLQNLNDGKIPPPETPPPTRATPTPAKAARKAVTSERRNPQPTTATPVPSREETAPPARSQEEEKETGRRHASASALSASRERLRDYVGAFVLAGLDPQTGAELEFFADRVDYFGERNVSREKIRRDLLRYDKKWPQRRFWLAGELEIKSRRSGEVEVTFPLRYELRHGAKHAAGTVRKTIVLQKTGEDDFKIVAVNERRGS